MSYLHVGEGIGGVVHRTLNGKPHDAPLRPICTTPSPVRLMASAGQTSAHVGWSQCMQTTGTVCTERDRSTNSRWIIDSPLCVSHSLQACTHAWQPMQRLGSMKNSRRLGTLTAAP